MPTAPNHTRRWFQFSLRTMLLLVNIFAAWLAWELSYVKQRRAAMDEVAGLGGGVWLADDVADEVACSWHALQNKALKRQRNSLLFRLIMVLIGLGVLVLSISGPANGP